MADKVKIPAAVLRGIEVVRKSGRTNMLARDIVAIIALELGYVEAALWLDDEANHKAYASGIFHGFEEAETPAP